MKVDKVTFKAVCDDFLKNVKMKRCEVSNDLQSTLQQRYGLSSNGVTKRFKSYYGKSINEMYKMLVTPAYNEVVSAVCTSDTWEDAKKKLKLNKHFSKGLLDKYFGCSTFNKAKAIATLNIKDVKFDPSICNNKGLLVSQMIGDGHYCDYRGAFTITHCDDQSEYLTYKVGLFNKAFPNTKPVSNIKNRTHTQGHKYNTWYSGRLPTKLTKYLKDKKEWEMVEDLTPFSLLILFLDDGYFDLDFTKRDNNYIGIYIHNDLTRKALKEELLTYQVTTTESNGVLKVGTYQSAVNFYKNFIEHYKSEIPECMQYKIEMKI